VTWTVEIGDECQPEYDDLPEDVQNEILAHTGLLQQFGPRLGRPRVDTLNDSRHANMKELGLTPLMASGGWPLPSDPKRKAILLVAGDKSGVSEKWFCKQLIAQADEWFDAHLNRLKKKEGK
jgi:hypothetical protein